MFQGLIVLARMRKLDGAIALGRVQGQLVESEDLAPGLEDALPSIAAQMKCTHLQFGHLLNVLIIGYSPCNYSFALLARKLHLADHP